MAQLVPWLKVIITARPVGDIQDYFAQKCPREPIIQLQDYDATANIRAYIEGQVAQLAENEHWPSDSIDQLCTMSGGPNFKKTNWPLFRQALEGKLAELPGLRRINSQEEIDKRVEDLMKEIYEAVRASTPDLKLCAWSKRWWSPELGAHRTLSRTLSARSYRARHDREDPVHEEYRLQRNRYSQAIKDAKRKHWEAFLEELDEDSMWTAARYLSMEPTDGGRTRVPSLKHALPDGTCTSLPPHPSDKTPTSTHPPPVEDLPELQTSDIRRVVYAMKPHKASGPDGLPACVYIHSIDLIDKHLLPIFRASLRLGIYPAAWRESRTVVLRKPGKPDYGLAKAYRPIALLNVISKVLSSCVANRLNSLAEEHGWLPDHHFGGRPGHTTTDALHLITKSIKDAWATKKVASALFLDVKGAFPHAYPPRLAENMKNLGVPAHYVNWMLAKLSGRSTCLSFDDYTSDPLPIDNGIDQGCPLSVIFYLFYNSPLVKVPRSNNELCIAYIDDITFVTWGHTFEDNHRTLTEMMSREGGTLDWSDSHNSTFELDKTACIDFAPPATSKNLDRPPLTIRDEVITPVKSHTLLGVTLDQTLNWRKQCDKALAKGMSWAGQLNRLARMSYGTPMKTARRLYLSIAVPRFSYARHLVLSKHKSPVTEHFDVLHRMTLEKAIDDEEDDIKAAYLRCIGAILAISERETLAAPDLQYLLLVAGGIDQLTLEQTIRNLSPLLLMTDGRRIRFHHPSFKEFVTDATRSGQFHIRLNQYEAEPAACCLQVMQQDLRFNICELETSHQLNSEVPDLKQRIDTHIGPALRYACMHWINHFVASPTQALVAAVKKLMEGPQLMYWIEALSLLGSLQRLGGCIMG
ncbi:reverse transcriptase from transposon X-element protein, putative, partial [Rhizoctonia solani AG-3 Rhs1AP]